MIWIKTSWMALVFSCSFILLSFEVRAGTDTSHCSCLAPKGATDQALSQATAIEKLYQSIKDQYFSSGKCHRYSDLPLKDQEAFKIKLYKDEVQAFGTEPMHTSNTPEDVALDTIIHDSGMSVTEADELRAQKLKLDEKILSPAVFQSSLIAALRKHLNDVEMSKYIDQRTTALFLKLGIPNDCDPNDNDFVSFEAFKEAYLARDQVKDSLKKGEIMTILDRSFTVGSRRLTTIDLKTGKVLFHTAAAFGDGDPSHGGPNPKEANVCSNKFGSNASPYGYGITTTTRTSQNFMGNGTFVMTPSSDGGALQDRGIAFHAMINGNDVFSRYGPMATFDGARPGDLLDKAIADPSQVDYLFNITIAEAAKPGATKGCVGIPVNELPQIESTLDGGSYVYFYCPNSIKNK